jgi:excisionase family DNA binding protein
MSEYMSVARAAERLGLSTATVRRRASLGELEAKRDGRAWLVKIDSEQGPPSIGGDDEPSSSPPGTATPEGIEVGSRQYWCGTLPGSPFQNIILAGLDFPSFIELIDHPDGTLKTQRTKVRGTVVHLSAQQVKAAQEAATKKVVRISGARTALLSVDSRFYKKTGGDEAVGCYVYLIPLEGAVEDYGAMWRETEPKPMIG